MEEVESQFKVWAAYLNNVVGLLALTFGLTCIGTHKPVYSAWLCLFVLLLIRVDGSKFFPKAIQQLRELAKDDEKAKLMLTGFDKKYVGFKTTFTQYHLFTFGMWFLLLIAYGDLATDYWPEFGHFIGLK